ncbi:hypothetical protein LUZ60_013726 [Juncus effusus]|nr:hypothetical protein LUZ60_013726 [Juncus effusus]
MDCRGIDFARKPGIQCRHLTAANSCSPKPVSQIHFHPSSKSKHHFNLTAVVYPMHPVYSKKSNRRAFSSSVGLEEGQPAELSESNDASESVSVEDSRKILTSEELKALMVDSERTKLTRKLSEANQYNRFLKRQVQTKDDALANFKSELAVLEQEFQALVGLAEEIVNSGIPPNSRIINGNYIHSHLLSRLQAVHEKIKEQIDDVDSVKFQDVSLTWVGMAESVQVMGSFDGWSNGEEMSTEYSGDYAKFSCILKLRPGRYEIKFLVDGEWQLSPEFPTIGEGLMLNNLLVVE